MVISLTIRRKSELPVGSDFSQNSRPYIIFKLPRDSLAMLAFLLFTAYIHAMFVFHWPWLTLMPCLLFIGHTLRARNTCFSLAIVPPRNIVSGNHFVAFIYGRMYLSTTSAGFIPGQGNILQESKIYVAIWVKKFLILFNLFFHLKKKKGKKKIKENIVKNSAVDFRRILKTLSESKYHLYFSKIMLTCIV